MTIGKKIGLNFLLAMAPVVAIGSVSYWCTAKLIATSQWVTHTYQVLEGLEALMSALKDAETGQRGYIITGKAPYLEPYEKGLSKIESGLRRLKSLTQDNPAQQGRLESLRGPIDEKLRELAETIEVRRGKGFEEALEIVGTDRGKRSMDEVRRIVDAIKSAESDLLEKRSKEANRTTTLANLAIGVGAPLTLILLSVAGLVISRSITGPIRSAVAQLASSSAEILATTTEQAAGAQEQAAAVSQTVTTVDQVAQTASQGAERAKGVGVAVQRNLEIGQAGRKSVEDSLAALDRLREQVESTAGNILMLADQAQAIGDIIATVNDIAEQTNMLALNAAIEASRAGEHGRGFAVVASEVKALADQSKKATGQVRQILGEIQRATNTAVLSTEEVTKGVGAAIRSGEQSGQTINALADTLADASAAAAQIVASAGQQAVGMQQINQAMKNLDQVARQNIAAMRQAEQAARNLNELGDQLARLLGR